jgi:hypothetical protein
VVFVLWGVQAQEAVGAASLSTEEKIFKVQTIIKIIHIQVIYK